MDRGIFGYNRDGFSFGRFATDVLLLSMPALALEAGAFALWRASIRLRGRS
jgi:hypothetical protein